MYQTGGPFISYTYDGASATNGAGDIIKRDASAAVNNNTVGVFSIVAPNVTTANATCTKTGSSDLFGISAANYTGAKQTGLPDATGSANTASGSGLSYTVTTVAADCWIMTAIGNTVGGAITGTSNYTTREVPVNGYGYGDSNGSVGAAGSKTVSFTGSSGRWWAASASYAPAVTGPAGVKTLNGTAVASVKTFNGTSWGSIKTFNGTS